MVGAGNYATATLLPGLRKSPDVELRGLVTSSGRTAAAVAKQFGFQFCASQFAELLAADTDAVLIATRHDTHAPYVCQALHAGKHVYVEKPLALRMDELVDVTLAMGAAPDRQLMIGFNRRFAPLTQELLRHFESVRSPRVVHIRVNAGYIGPDHWSQDPLAGGGRLLGEACHFVDLASTLTASVPTEVFCTGVGKPGVSPLLNDNVCVALRFANGSIASITYCADGSKAMAKEHVEIFGGGRSAVLDDFREATLYWDDSRSRKVRLGTQDKGQNAMLAAWAAGLRSGSPALPVDTAMGVSAASIAIVESLTIGQPVAVHPALWQPPEAALTVMGDEPAAAEV